MTPPRCMTSMFPYAVKHYKRLQKRYRSYEMAKDLDKNEWYFVECPEDELEYCWTYEYARESEYLRTIITMWRQGAKGNKIEEYISLEEELGAETSDASVYPFFPCWPI